MYDIPEAYPCHEANCDKFISFNYVKTEKNPENLGVHFFLDDYQFQRVWDKPTLYIEKLKKFKAVCSPDFSLYFDYPFAVQLWNHYRKMWLTTFYQEYGINMVPTVCWGTPATFDFCFDGMPVGSVVAVSSVGATHGYIQSKVFQAGFEEMLHRLEPVEVLFYGIQPDWLSEMPCKITGIGTASERFDTLHIKEGGD